MRSFPTQCLRLAIAIAGLSAVPASALDEALLTSRIEQLETNLKTGRLGVGVQDLATGQAWFHRGDDRFPMQSVYKVPIALAVLWSVDQERIALHEKVRVRRSDLGPPHSPLAAKFEGDHRDIPLRALIEMAVGESDGTASDVLLRVSGGPKSVTGLLRVLGINGVRVDRAERQLQPDLAGLGRFRKEWAEPGVMMRAVDRLSKARRRRALKTYLDDPRDTATPRGMTSLLARLQSGELLSGTTTQFLLDVMTGTPTGPARLKAGLPEGARLAHKTGTARTVLGTAPATNDVGIVTLPDGRKLVVVAFLSGAQGSDEDRERILADVARVAVEAMP